MFKSKFIKFTFVMIQMVLLSNVAMSEELQYSPEMKATCEKLSDGIDTSDWLIDEDLPVLDDSNLDRLDDGWNKEITKAHDKMLELCKADEKSNECWLAKGSERELKKSRYSCYYAILMRAI